MSAYLSFFYEEFLLRYFWLCYCLLNFLMLISHCIVLACFFKLASFCDISCFFDFVDFFSSSFSDLAAFFFCMASGAKFSFVSVYSFCCMQFSL